MVVVAEEGPAERPGISQGPERRPGQVWSWDITKLRGPGQPLRRSVGVLADLRVDHRQPDLPLADRHVLSATDQMSPIHAAVVRAIEEAVDDAATWQAVVDAWREISHIPHLGWALLRLAAVALRTDDRCAAAPQLAEAWSLAERLGAFPLQDAVIDLARRSRIQLDHGDQKPTPTAGWLGR